MRIVARKNGSSICLHEFFHMDILTFGTAKEFMHQETILTACFSMDNKQIAIVCPKNIYILDSKTGKELYSITVTSRTITDIAFIGKNALLVKEKLTSMEAVSRVSIHSGQWQELMRAEHITLDIKLNSVHVMMQENNKIKIIQLKSPTWSKEFKEREEIEKSRRIAPK